MKSQSTDICSFSLVQIWTSGSKHLDMHTDQPVHDLNPYVLCSYELFLSRYAEAGSKLNQTGVCFTKVFRTELGHKYILVECSVIALCLPVMSKLPVLNSCAINRTMIGMSIKRISVLNLCHVLKPFVKSTPAQVHCFI